MSIYHRKKLKFNSKIYPLSGLIQKDNKIKFQLPGLNLLKEPTKREKFQIIMTLIILNF